MSDARNDEFANFFVLIQTNFNDLNQQKDFGRSACSGGCSGECAEGCSGGCLGERERGGEIKTITFLTNLQRVSQRLDE